MNVVKWNRTTQVLLMLFIIVCEAILFLYLDKCNHLNKGMSVRTYHILPFNTKIQAERHHWGYYYFYPTTQNGLHLESNFYFYYYDSIYSVPTSLYDKRGNIIDTIYISTIWEYGFRENDMVIQVSTDGHYQWLQPIWKGRSVIITPIEEEDIDKKAYHWVRPHSGKALFIILMWLSLFVIIPASVIYWLYLIGKE